MAAVTSKAIDVANCTPLEYRQIQADLEADGLARLGPLSPTLTEKAVSIPLSSSHSAKVKLIYAAGPATKPRPLIVLWYGGAFRSGSCYLMTEPGRTFAERFNAVVALGSYRTVPEVQWPVPWRDGWDLLAFLSHHAHEPEFGQAELASANGGGFVVGGISAGATIASACVGIDSMGLAEREGVEKLAKPVTGLFANVPWLFMPEIVPEAYESRWKSRTENENSPGFGLKSLEAVAQALDCTDYTSCWFSPVPELLRRPGPLHEHPRVNVTVCQLDPLRDDGKLFCDLLQERGVESRLDIFTEDGHTGWTVVPKPWKSTNPAVKPAYIEGMKWLLRK
jgi:acetyl esterase/lipase